MKMSKKLFSLVLSAVLVLTLIPAASFAASGEPNFSFTVNGGTKDVVVISPGDTVTVEVELKDMTVAAWTGGITCDNLDVLQFESISGKDGKEVRMGYSKGENSIGSVNVAYSELDDAVAVGNVGSFFFDNGEEREFFAFDDENEDYTSTIVVEFTALEVGDAVIFGYENSDGQNPVEIDEFAPVTVKVRNKVEISFDFDVPVELEVGETFDGAATLAAGDAALTYGSSNKVVADVDPITGEVTAVAPGEAVITVSAPESMEYQAVELSYTVIVKDIPKGSVGGNLTTFKDTDVATTVELIPAGATEAAYTTTVTEYTLISSTKKDYSSNYEFGEVADGTYTLRISKKDHVTREYEVVVNGSAVEQDVQINLLGDINSDGKTNAKDYARVKSHINKTNTMTGYEFDCANTSGDKSVNAKDYAQIKAHINKTKFLWQ